MKTLQKIPLYIPLFSLLAHYERWNAWLTQRGPAPMPNKAAVNNEENMTIPLLIQKLPSVLSPFIFFSNLYAGNKKAPIHKA